MMFSSLLRLSRPWKTLHLSATPTTSIRHYWWGHDSKEVDLRRKLELERRHAPIKWSQPGNSVAEGESFTYTPRRYEQEGIACQSGFSEDRFNHADMQQWLSQPIPYISWKTNPSYWERDQLLKDYRDLVVSQMFSRDAIMHLGPDLTAAYFLVARNCRVRFKGHDDWAVWNTRSMTMEGVPTDYTPGWYVEAIDASGSQLVYEGFNNLRNLLQLKYLDLSYCDYIDAWCLDRITGEYRQSLEYLDLSGCVSLNWNAIECLWRLEKLKTLVLYDLDHIQDLPLLCLMLLDIFPNLEIKGVDYINPKMLEGTEHEHLLKELDELKLLEEGELESKEEMGETKKSN